MSESGQRDQRISIPYFSGVNGAVQKNLAKKNELVHAENARTKVVGALEKREGQTKVGTAVGGSPFYADENYGLTKFINDSTNQGVYRVLEPQPSYRSISVTEAITVQDIFTTTTFNFINLSVSDSITVEDEFFGPILLSGNTGFKFPTTNGITGYADWTDPTNAYTDDGTFATRVDNAGTYKKQSYGTFTLGVPLNATIVGIDVRMKGKVSAAPGQIGVILLRTVDGTTSEVWSYEETVDGTNTEYTEGGASTVLGTGWTGALMADGIFSIAVRTPASNNGKTYSVDYVKVNVYYTVPATLQVKVNDSITVGEPALATALTGTVISISPSASAGLANIYALSSGSEWTILSDTDANNIVAGQCDFANADRKLVIVNRNDYNRLISSDGTTVISASTAGSLYNSPNAGKVAFYKNRIYLGNFLRESVRYPTTVIRSSFPLGIVALVDGDSTTTTLSVTDTKYFYSTTGMNTYEVYRGGVKIGNTITVTSVNENNVTLSEARSFLSSDEIWVEGTFDGEKQYRWVNNPTSTGRDVKQYDTFKLSGGDEDEMTLLETIGNVLLLGNKNALMSWNDYTLENFDLGVGCVSLNGYTKLMGSLYFIHYSGVYMTTGGVPTLISRKVDRYIKGATKAGLEASAAGFKGFSVFFTLGDVILYNEDGSTDKTLSDVCLEYNIADQDWFVHTNVPAKEFATFIDSTGAEKLLMTHTATEKYVKEFLSGNTDDGDAIFYRADLPKMPLSKEIEMYANPLSVVTETERGVSMKCYVKLDDGEFYEINGNIGKGVSVLKVTSKDDSITQPPICREIQLSFRDSSAQICKMTQVDLIYQPTQVEQST